MAELTEEQIKMAKVWKHCPFCKGHDFFATFELAGRDFRANVRDGIIWAKRNEEGIQAVECLICKKEIPKEIWEKWGLET
ncbi:unnamed protein product [marine sediment metagenome]|uniref:Uncharacterized protein n=1 Tax=marine sediment metagenome TaxID=412755 RepID=X1EQK8_9ZZZZ